MCVCVRARARIRVCVERHCSAGEGETAGHTVNERERKDAMRDDERLGCDL